LVTTTIQDIGFARIAGGRIGEGLVRAFSKSLMASAILMIFSCMGSACLNVFAAIGEKQCLLDISP
jgi:hypothetical protein